MAQYIVERTLPGITPDQLADAARAARRTATQMAEEGTPVRYLRSTFLPEEERCFCLFEGDSSETVVTVNERAGLPYDRVVEAMHIAAEDLSS